MCKIITRMACGFSHIHSMTLLYVINSFLLQFFFFYKKLALGILENKKCVTVTFPVTTSEQGQKTEIIGYTN